MNKKFIKGLGIGAMCVAGAVGLTGCNTNDTNDTDDVKIVSIDVLEETIPASVEAGDFDESNIVLLVKYSDNTEKKIHLTEEYVKDAYKSKLYQTGEHTIWIDYNGFTDTLNINVTMSDAAIATKFRNAVKYAVEHDSVMTYKNSYFDCGAMQEYNATINHHYNSENEEVETYGEYDYEDAAGTKVKQCSFANTTEAIMWTDGYCEHSLNDLTDNSADNYAYTFINGYLSEIAKSGVGLYTAEYFGEIKNSELVYTAKFTKTEDDESVECIFTFTEDKLLTAKSIVDTEISEVSYDYKTLTDAQMYKADAMSKKSALLSKISETNTLINELKGREFTVKIADDKNGTNEKTYTHTANSDVLTSSFGNLNFTDVFPTITTYGEVNYTTADGELCVDYEDGGQITFTIKGGLTSVLTYNYGTLGTKYITISYNN